MIERTSHSDSEPITLKVVGEYVGLAKGTVSSILNRRPQSLAIPKPTRDRVFAAAEQLNYRPNPFARALRAKQSLAGSGKSISVNRSHTLVFDDAEEFRQAVTAIRRAGLRVPGGIGVASDGQPSAF